MSIADSPAQAYPLLSYRNEQVRWPQSILILDPDRDSRQIMHALLRASGYFTMEAASIDEVRRFAPPSGFALVITEARGGDEHSVLPVAVREEFGMTGVPLIVHTSWLQPEDQIAALTSGALAFIAKPCDLRALLRLVARVVQPGCAALGESDRPGPALR